MSDKAEVNLNGVKQSKGVWLVKVPKYLPQQWDRATGKREVGKITIAKKEGKTEVRFSLNEELTALGAAEEKDGSLQVPTVHPITMHTVGGQTLAVFSQNNSGVSAPDGWLDCESALEPRSRIMSSEMWWCVVSVYLTDAQLHPHSPTRRCTA